MRVAADLFKESRESLETCKRQLSAAVAENATLHATLKRHNANLAYEMGRIEVLMGVAPPPSSSTPPSSPRCSR